MENRRKLGAAYEKKAELFLAGRGMRILARNFRSRFGEIDLIAEDHGELVFVEVKYRRNSVYGRPEEAVHPAKQRKICRTADFYRVMNQISDDTACHFSVVAIEGDQIRYYPDAFLYQC